MMSSAQACAAAAYSDGSSPNAARYSSMKLARMGPMELCDAYEPSAAAPADAIYESSNAPLVRSESPERKGVAPCPASAIPRRSAEALW